MAWIILVLFLGKQHCKCSIMGDLLTDLLTYLLTTFAADSKDNNLQSDRFLPPSEVHFHLGGKNLALGGRSAATRPWYPVRYLRGRASLPFALAKQQNLKHEFFFCNLKNVSNRTHFQTLTILHCSCQFINFLTQLSGLHLDKLIHLNLQLIARFPLTTCPFTVNQ